MGGDLISPANRIRPDSRYDLRPRKIKESYLPRSDLLFSFLLLVLFAGCDHPSERVTPKSAPLSEIAKLQQSAEAGNAKAQLEVARGFDKGIGVKEDQQAAFGWYLKAANSRVSDAMVEVAKRYRDGRGTKFDWELSRHWFARAAEAGNAEAQYEMGPTFVSSLTFSATTYGENFQEEKAKAQERIAWLEKSAAQDYLPALNDLAIVYLIGTYVCIHCLSGGHWEEIRPPEFLEMWDSFSLSVVTGLVWREHHDVRLKRLTEPNVDKGISTLIRAAEKGYWKSQLTLAAIYQFGFEKIKPNAELANKWWDSLSKQTESSAALGIGELYCYAGNPQNYHARNWHKQNLSMYESNQLAKGWFEKAAAKGNGDASYRLAQMHWNGVFGYKDDAKAFRMLNKAVLDRTNYRQARYELAVALLEGRGTAKDYSRALELFKAIAIKDPSEDYKVPDARANVAGFYEFGFGVIPDPVLAYAWWNIAAAAGSSYAKGHLPLLETKLKPAEIIEAQSITRDWQPGTDLTRQKKATASSASSITDSNLTQVGSGSGFAISENTYILTNNHVIDGCTQVRIPPGANLGKVIATDSINDLAVVKIDAQIKTHAVMADSYELKQGDEIVVFGYPLAGYLASSGNVATGIIAALSGPGNNASLIQISAPVQPGNSGGPVLDKKGRVVAVVVGKADSIKIAKAIGDIPQNVNFAIDGRTVKSFLDANRIKYETSGSWFRSSRTPSELANEAKEFSVKVECWR